MEGSARRKDEKKDEERGWRKNDDWKDDKRSGKESKMKRRKERGEVNVVSFSFGYAFHLLRDPYPVNSTPLFTEICTISVKDFQEIKDSGSRDRKKEQNRSNSKSESKVRAGKYQRPGNPKSRKSGISVV